MACGEFVQWVIKTYLKLNLVHTHRYFAFLHNITCWTNKSDSFRLYCVRTTSLTSTCSAKSEHVCASYQVLGRVSFAYIRRNFPHVVFQLSCCKLHNVFEHRNFRSKISTTCVIFYAQGWIRCMHSSCSGPPKGRRVLRVTKRTRSWWSAWTKDLTQD